MADITITQGDDEVQSWVIYDDSGDPLDITGGKLWFTVKTNYIQTDPGELQLTSPSSGLVLTSAADGEVTMTITNTQSAALTAQTYVYDIQFKDVNGKITTLETGTLEVKPQVTTSTS